MRFMMMNSLESWNALDSRNEIWCWKHELKIQDHYCIAFSRLRLWRTRRCGRRQTSTFPQSSHDCHRYWGVGSHSVVSRRELGRAHGVLDTQRRPAGNLPSSFRLMSNLISVPEAICRYWQPAFRLSPPTRDSGWTTRTVSTQQIGACSSPMSKWKIKGFTSAK